MAFRPRNYDYHARRPSFYQRARYERWKLAVLVASPCFVLTSIVYLAVFYHR